MPKFTNSVSGANVWTKLIHVEEVGENHEGSVSPAPVSVVPVALICKSLTVVALAKPISASPVVSCSRMILPVISGARVTTAVGVVAPSLRKKIEEENEPA